MVVIRPVILAYFARQSQASLRPRNPGRWST